MLRFGPRGFQERGLGGRPLLILLAAWAAAALPSAAAGAVGGDTGVPSAPEPFRLRQLWSAPWLFPARLNSDFETVQAGVYLGWKEEKGRATHPGKGRALVALDLRTGREIWQLAGFPDQPQVIFAGDLALLPKNSATLAVSIASGRQQWTSPVCAFREHLQVTGEAGREIGVGLCRDPVLPPVDPDAGPHLRYHHYRTEAVDLRTGRILWQLTQGPRIPVLGTGPGAILMVMRVGDGHPADLRLRVLDPRVGTVRGDFPIQEEHAYWIHVSPRRPKQAVVLGYEISAVDLESGRVLWRRERPMWWANELPRRPVVQEDRLFLSYRDSVYEFDLRKGAPRGTYVLPDRLGTESLNPRLLPLPDGGLLVVAYRRNQPPVAIRFAGPGAAPELATVPGDPLGVLAVQDGVIVLLNSRKRELVLEGYGDFAPPAEATAVEPRK